MDKALYDYLERKLREEKRGEDSRDERSYGNRSYEDSRNYGDSRDYEDERRGVKGTGPYGIGGSKHYGRGRDMDDERGARMPKLTKAEKLKWKHMLQNTDGTQGEHYDMQQIIHVADQMGLRFRDYDEKDFCLIVNWLYSDFGRSISRHLPPDKALMLLSDMAAEWFDDPDGPEPDDKMSTVFHTMVHPYGKV